MKKRIKRMMINPEVLFHVFQTSSAWKVEMGIPEGAIMKGFTLDPSTQLLSLFVEHESFDEIEIEREPAPYLDTSFKRL